jgi:hypothetical protein
MAQNENEDTQVADDPMESGSIDLQATLDTALELVETQAKEHPFRTLGIAMGLGYVLGGGLPKILVRLGMLAAGRVLTDAITAEGLRTLSNNLGGVDGEDKATASGKRTPNGHHRKRAPARERQARE